MARYKHIDVSPRFLAVDLKRQLLPGMVCSHSGGALKLLRVMRPATQRPSSASASSCASPAAPAALAAGP